MIDPFRRTFRVEPIRSIDDLEQRVQWLGFFPMFSCGIPGYSVYENTPRFWTDDEDGPWEWKGPMIQNGNVGYGKFFNRKAGYVSLEWVPDFLNYLPETNDLSLCTFYLLSLCSKTIQQ